jgi:hypothetical protein
MAIEQITPFAGPRASKGGFESTIHNVVARRLNGRLHVDNVARPNATVIDRL